MINLFTQLLDLIYKKRCYFCRSSSENSSMCKRCYDEIELLEPRPLISLYEMPVYSAAVYAKDVQKMIRALKYHNRRELAFFQAKLMYDYWQEIEEKSQTYTIIPVPLFKSREKKRKYNHMLLVAQEFARLTGYCVNNNLLKRIKDTKPQYRLTLKEREKNLNGAFEVDKSSYDGENLLLIDDILTTGSTLSEMIKKLHKEEIDAITCFTTSCTGSHV